MHFRIPALVVINKADIYPQGVVEIEAACAELEVELIGQIPFDLTVTEAIVHSEPVTAYEPGSPASKAIGQIWKAVIHRMTTSEGKV